uniref:Uncharacterized protein n=1 Tax=Tanacetum cinerariifolium TaxID=118510 RepID=A0A6L2J6N7_TANCI|nr:hypothetical protein [Tanacetum cinerariifolium]
MSPDPSASIAEVEAVSDLAFRKRFRSFYDSSPSPTLPVRKRYKGFAARDGGPGIRVVSLGLGGDETMHKGQKRAAPVTETAVGEPLGLGYGALRRQRIASREGLMPSVFEVDPEDGIAYIDVPAYPSPAPLVRTPPSPEWLFGSFPISPAPSIIPLPISSPMISLIVPSPVASPATVEAEGFLTELGA